MVKNQLSTRAPFQQTSRTWHCWGLFLQEHVLWSCNTHWNSLAPSGCPTGSGPIPWPLSCGSEDTTAASAVNTSSVPQSFQLLANPWYPATSSTFTLQECGFLPTAHAPFPVGQMFHFSTTCPWRTSVIYPATSAAPQALMLTPAGPF